jgi:mRNA-degrading endonuclease toxin of MazEF toxin-antitoxin module
MINQTRAVDKARLIKKLGHLSAEIVGDIDQALKLHYDLE